MPFAVIGRVMDYSHSLIAELRDQFGIGVILVDHCAIDAMHFRILVAIGDVGQHGTPNDDRKSKLVIDIDRRNRRG